MSYSRRSRYSPSPSPDKRHRRYVSRSRSLSRSRSCDSGDVENPGNNLYVAGLSPRISKKDIEKHFSAEGKARRRRGRTPTPGRYLGLKAACARSRRSPSYSPYSSRSRSYDDRYYRSSDYSRDYSPDDRWYRRGWDRSYTPDDRYYARRAKRERPYSRGHSSDSLSLRSCSRRRSASLSSRSVSISVTPRSSPSPSPSPSRSR